MNIIEYFDKTPYKIFLADALGALVSVTFLLLIRCYKEIFNVLEKDINILIYIPFILAVYSFGAYFLKPKKWFLYLNFVAVANLLYCLYTLYLVTNRFEVYSFLALIYFISEIVVILLLVSVELKLASKKR